MAHFAKLGLNSKVISVVVVADEDCQNGDGLEDETVGIQFLERLFGWPLWKRTSYNTVENVHLLGGTPFRKNYAGIGCTYDEDRDAFIPPCKFASWILNEDKCVHEAPVPFPVDGKNYTWDEENTQWIPKTDYSRRDGP